MCFWNWENRWGFCFIYWINVINGKIYFMDILNRYISKHQHRNSSHLFSGVINKSYVLRLETQDIYFFIGNWLLIRKFKPKTKLNTKIKVNKLKKKIIIIITQHTKYWKLKQRSKSLHNKNKTVIKNINYNLSRCTDTCSINSKTDWLRQ